MKKSLTVNSFCVISGRTGTTSFACFYVEVAITKRIGLNGGNPFIRGLCTLGYPNSVPGFEPTGLILL